MKKSFCGLLLVFLAPVASCLEAKDFFGTWRWAAIENEFGDTQAIEADNFVVLDTDHVMLIMKDYGKRRYDGVWLGHTFLQNDFELRWEIIDQNDRELRVKTPLGVYVLEAD